MAEHLFSCFQLLQGKNFTGQVFKRASGEGRARKDDFPQRYGVHSKYRNISLQVFDYP
jgi:hypothetical protein